MAKTIKFNLICDNKPVRTIEDLQNNFSIEDMLAYYDNGLLLRWLNARGYKDEYDKVLKISSKEPIEIIKNLIAIFNVESDERKIAESIYMLKYLNERKEVCEIYEKQNYQVKSIIDDYVVGYKQLVDEIFQNPDDIAKIKSNIAEIANNYEYLLKLNHRNLFFVLLAQQSHLAIMCLLMNEQVRKYYLPIETTNEDGSICKDIDSNGDKKEMYEKLCKLIINPDSGEGLANALHSFAGKTEGYWKDIEPKGKKYMIISIPKGSYVRSANENGGDLGYNDILNRFIILDGIDYKSNDETHQLWYMEV